MMQLCKTSREMFCKYKQAFWNRLRHKEITKDLIEFEKGFSKKTAQFILEKNRYLNYEFIIHLRTILDIYNFCAFLRSESLEIGQRVPETNKGYVRFLCFKKVELKKEVFKIKHANQIYEAVTQAGIDPKFLRFNFPKDFDPLEFSRKLEYVPKVKNLHAINEFKRIEILDLQRTSNLIGLEAQVHELRCSVKTVEILYKAVVEKSEEPDFDERFRNSLKTLTFINVRDRDLMTNSEEDFKIIENRSFATDINELRKVFPNLQNLSYEYFSQHHWPDIFSFFYMAA